MPNEFEKEFAAAGLTNSEYILYIEKSLHRLNPAGLHTNAGGNWNRVWAEFFQTFQEAGTEQYDG